MRLTPHHLFSRLAPTPALRKVKTSIVLVIVDVPGADRVDDGAATARMGKMMNNVTKTLLYSAAAAGFGAAAQRSARQLGWPAASVGLLGTLALALWVGRSW
jgi:hypothetical protein